MRKATLVAALLLLTPAVSQAKTLEDLLVERGVITKGEAAGASDSSASKLYWNQGTRVEFPDTGFTTSVATMLQTRYSFTDPNQSPGTIRNKSSFDVNRARLIVSGTALNREFSYMLSTDFVSAPDSDANFGQSPQVRDAYIDWTPCKDDTGLRLGVFKTAFSRQFNTNQQSMQFVDRSVTSEFFTLGRENGAMAYGSLADGMITGSAGIFNGESSLEGPNSPAADTRHTGIVSLRVNPTGKMNVAEEGDIDWTEEMATSLGVAYARASRELAGSPGTNNADLVNVDANVKYMGLGIHAEYFFSNSDKDPAFGDDRTNGFYVQGGYFVVPKRLELAARYGRTDCADGNATSSLPQGNPVTCIGSDSISEASASLNYYFWRHNLKAQLGYDYVNYDLSGSGQDLRSNRYVFQLSSYF
jgi:phosphate-selective porin OprO/OprP